jgi:uncharacterized surface protein with fasciclin (FAS1) repeats
MEAATGAMRDRRSRIRERRSRIALHPPIALVGIGPWKPHRAFPGSPDHLSRNLPPMKLHILPIVALAIAGAGLPAPVFAQAQKAEKTVRVGGAPMYPSKTIVQNAVNSKDHTTLVAAVKAAGLVDTLSGPGPFTVFAPTNKAFGKLPKGTVETLVQPQNKTALTGILTYHVVPGRYTAQDLMTLVKQGSGQAQLKTVQGGTLVVTPAGKNKLSVTDAKGDKAIVTIPNVMQSNGVIHVIDTVLLPS